MFSSMDSATLLRLFGQTVLLLAFLSFIIQWLTPKVRKLFDKNRQTLPSESESDLRSAEKNKIYKEKIRINQQQLHTEKASSFNERILIPREKEKLKQKEEKYLKFIGPAWKGEGQILGGIETDEHSNDISPSLTAARHRQLPEQQPTTEPNIPKPDPKPKRVIILPPEPKENEDCVITVKLRTPIRSVCQRRFLQSNTIQDLLDFMTTVGYSQTFNTLSTTYPRNLLTEYASSTLEELGFKKQITLNIEEKE